MLPRLWVSSAKFSDGQEIEFAKNDIVVLVGPNNVGKSAALRAIDDMARAATARRPVISALILKQEGSAADLLDWLDAQSYRSEGEQGLANGYLTISGGINSGQVEAWWQGASQSNEHNRLLVKHFAADQRLAVAASVTAIRPVDVAPKSLLHYVHKYDTLEPKLCQLFNRAFGEDLILDRGPGVEVTLYTGKRPAFVGTEDRASSSYSAKVRALRRLDDQGDGMRSFAGVLLQAFVGAESILLIDEPEAFLHPPQARLLAQVLGTERASERQLFVATHSGDVLRGLLDAAATRLRVIRLRRESSVNIPCELDSAAIQEVWGNSLLRTSNILEGVFHDRVIICEGDSDCRFYRAMLDALADAGPADERRSDIMFAHCGGVDRAWVVVEALKRLEVPVRVAVDFDVLREGPRLKRLVESLGGVWAGIDSDWKYVKAAVDAFDPEWTSSAMRVAIEGILVDGGEAISPEEIKRQVGRVLQKASPWSEAKQLGLECLKDAEARRRCARLLIALEAMGLFVVPVGELEGFFRASNKHGPGWVNDALAKDLVRDGSLAEARQFVSALAG